jgi:hypothetical protein
MARPAPTARLAAVVAVILGLGLGAGAVAQLSCSVTRRSSELACTSSSDCKDSDRHCVNGYCVEHTGSSSDGCPAGCTSCDLSDPTNPSCEIDCDSSDHCGDIACPAPFNCTIKCNGAGACGDVGCGAVGACDVTCTGGGACGDIDCLASCKCDVHCNGDGSCGDMTCPLRQTQCTHGGMAGAPCDSSVNPACNLCS